MINHNHPVNFRSTHAFFFNLQLKYTNNWKIKYTPKRIGNDVWIGMNTIIVPSVTEIGRLSSNGWGFLVRHDGIITPGVTGATCI